MGVMKREREVFQGARLRLSPSEQNDFDAIANILARADGVQAKLAELGQPSGCSGAEAYG